MSQFFKKEIKFKLYFNFDTPGIENKILKDLINLFH